MDTYMKHKLRYKIAVLGTLTLFSLTALAGEVKEAGKMIVQIGNMTHVNCQLIDSQLAQGTYVTVPPQVIQSGDSKEFKAQQAVRGPKVILTYKCDDNSITFSVHQRLVVAVGHTPKAKVIKAQGLSLNYKSTSSSTIWHTAGILNITLSDS